MAFLCKSSRFVPSKSHWARGVRHALSWKIIYLIFTRLKLSMPFVRVLGALNALTWWETIELRHRVSRRLNLSYTHEDWCLKSLLVSTWWDLEMFHCWLPVARIIRWVESLIWIQAKLGENFRISRIVSYIVRCLHIYALQSWYKEENKLHVNKVKIYS